MKKKAFMTAVFIALLGNISWYGTGTPGNYTACYREYKGRYFKITYHKNTIIVKCNDTGAFEHNGSGRVLDLSVDAFKTLAPLRQGIIKEAEIEVLKEL